MHIHFSNGFELWNHSCNIRNEIPPTVVKMFMLALWFRNKGLTCISLSQNYGYKIILLYYCNAFFLLLFVISVDTATEDENSGPTSSVLPTKLRIQIHGWIKVLKPELLKTQKWCRGIQEAVKQELWTAKIFGKDQLNPMNGVKWSPSTIPMWHLMNWVVKAWPWESLQQKLSEINEVAIGISILISNSWRCLSYT